MSSRARHHGSTAVLSPRRPRRTCVRRAPRVPPRVDLQTLHSEHERILMTRRGWRRVGGARPGWQQIQAHDLGQSNCRASLWIMWVPSRSQRQKRRHRALQPASPCHNLCLLCLQSRRSIDVLLRTTFLCKHLHDILELVVEMLLGADRDRLFSQLGRAGWILAEGGIRKPAASARTMIIRRGYGGERSKCTYQRACGAVAPKVQVKGCPHAVPGVGWNDGVTTQENLDTYMRKLIAEQPQTRDWTECPQAVAARQLTREEKRGEVIIY